MGYPQIIHILSPYLSTKKNGYFHMFIHERLDFLVESDIIIIREYNV